MSQQDGTPKRSLSDTLANERTYLAYLRTALAFVGFGFVIARFALFTREISLVAHVSMPPSGSSKVFGVAMVIAGILVALGGATRYTVTNRAIRRGENSALPPTASFIGAIVIAIIGTIVAIDLFRFTL